MKTQECFQHIATLAATPCVVCDKEIEPFEARMVFPGHLVQAHMGCGETPRTFYRPEHSEAGCEATYWSREEAEAAIKDYDGDEEMAEGEWKITEKTMTPAAYLQLPEFDGF